MHEDFKRKALRYHAEPGPGKIALTITKPCETQEELSLAYTPGVAEPARAIEADPEAAYRYTAKGNLVAVITDGSAVLGLGDIGPLASKPVMEGKGVLFKRFADVDVFDLEVDADSAETFMDTIVRIAPGFGGINLEDVAAPKCFAIEAALVKRLDIPVFHDDQHGTAIIVTAGLLNALELQGKSLQEARIVCVGAGAAGIASLRMLVEAGAARDHILLVDRAGVVHNAREDINEYKREFAADTPLRTLEEAVRGADVFVGVSGPDLLTPEMLRSMAVQPVVFALSNPDPEIRPELAHATRKDLILATGRSDYPNQVNNVLGFPFIFRGTLDVRAREINTQMKVAAAGALSALAREPVPAEVLAAYGRSQLTFGPEYIIPTPLDPRLKAFVSAAVARAAVDSGVARSPYPDDYPQ